MIFLYSVQNLSIYWYGLYCFILALLIFKRRISLNPVSIFVLTTFCSVAAFCALTIEGVIQKVYFVICSYSITAYLFINTTSSKFLIKSLFNSALIFSICAVLQQFVFLIASEYLDFHHILTMGKYLSRPFSNLIADLNLIRPTITQIEPANAASAMVYLAGSSWLLGRSNMALFFLLIAIFTVSVAGVIVSLAMCALIIARDFMNLGLKSRVLFATLFAILLLLSIGYIERLNFGYNAVENRLKIFSIFLNSSLVDLLFGHGILIFDEPRQVNGVLVYDSFLRDPGALFSLLFSFGLLGFGMFIFSILRYGPSSDLFARIIMFLPFCTKLDYMHPLFWFYWFLIVSVNSKLYPRIVRVKR